MNSVSIVLLVAVLSTASATDIAWRRIPNALVVAGLVAALAVALRTEGALGAGASLIGATVGLVLMLPAFALRLLGAGDAKLMAVVGAFVGLPGILWTGLYTFAAGGVLAIAVLSVTGRGRESLRNLRQMVTGLLLLPAGGADLVADVGRHSAARLPYALAIAAGSAAWIVVGPIA